MGAFQKSLTAKQIIKNPTTDDLRNLAREEEITTEYGSAMYVTKIRNRSAKLTFIVEDRIKVGVRQSGICLEKAEALATQVRQYLKDQEVLEVNRRMGQHPDMMLKCRMYITKKYARLGFMWHKTLFDPEPGDEPDLCSIYVPEWPERIIFCHPEEQITFILGTDYFGEAKKSFLRMAMYLAKKRGGIGLHAGSKILHVKTKTGDFKDVGFIMFGLSGTGKTTLTMHNHGLSGDECVQILQDDVVLMTRSGFCYGTENGFFIKTEGLEPSQTVLWTAAIKPAAVFENVHVGPDGKVDFLNYQLTTNGRGVIARQDCPGTVETVDLPKAHKVLFITRRNDIVPIVAKLNPAQGAAYFMLGESIETSAGDPTKAGQSKREVGTNPFIVGSEAEEGNRIFEILSKNPEMECYIVNTGMIGARADSPGEKITVKVTTEVMKAIARDTIDWKIDPDWGYLVPAALEGIDSAKYEPRRYYSSDEYQERTEKLRQERIDWLKQFTELRPEIQAAVEKK
jgi:phosphoenolpyruvate carboxykinase (ATP)